MCTREETEQIVNKMGKELEEKLFKSHTAIAETVSNLGNELKEDRERNKKEHEKIHEKLDTLDIRALNNMAKFYSGSQTMGGFIMWLSKVILSITAIGASLVYMINRSIH